MSSPFDFNEWMSKNQTRHLTNIVNRSIMPTERAERLLNAYAEGEELQGAFVEERMIRSPEKFLNPIVKCKVPTFATTNKPVKIQTGKERIDVFKSGRDFFQRCSIVSQKRDIDMAKVLTYELAAVPLSMAHLNGDMRKTNKSAFPAGTRRKNNVTTTS